MASRSGSGPLGAVAQISWLGHPAQAADLPAVSLLVPGQSALHRKIRIDRTGTTQAYGAGKQQSIIRTTADRVPASAVTAECTGHNKKTYVRLRLQELLQREHFWPLQFGVQL